MDEMLELLIERIDTNGELHLGAMQTEALVRWIRQMIGVTVNFEEAVYRIAQLQDNLAALNKEIPK